MEEPQQELRPSGEPFDIGESNEDKEAQQELRPPVKQSLVGEQQHETPARKHPAHGVLIGEPTIVFVTACTKDRKPWLANEIVHTELRQAWSQANAWLVGRYVIMPDHVHLFAAPAGNVD